MLPFCWFLKGVLNTIFHGFSPGPKVTIFSCSDKCEWKSTFPQVKAFQHFHCQMVTEVCLICCLVLEEVIYVTSIFVCAILCNVKVSKHWLKWIIEYDMCIKEITFSFETASESLLVGIFSLGIINVDPYQQFILVFVKHLFALHWIYLW